LIPSVCLLVVDSNQNLLVFLDFAHYLVCLDFGLRVDDLDFYSEVVFQDCD
jgi:hypothetical protein